MEDFKVGDRVIFSGPEYTRYNNIRNGPLVGQKGVIIRRDGYRSQKSGEKEVEIITVKFDNDDRPSNIDINRITLVKSASG